MPRGSKGLAASRVIWGLSCEVADEASMGVILGHMKLFGAVNIGFAPLGPAVKRRKTTKDPVAVESGRKGGLARQAKRRATGSRKPLLAAAEEALNGLSGPEFKAAELYGALGKLGWKGSSQHHRAVSHLIGSKLVRRKLRGRYIKL